MYYEILLVRFRFRLRHSSLACQKKVEKTNNNQKKKKKEEVQGGLVDEGSSDRQMMEWDEWFEPCGRILSIQLPPVHVRIHMSSRYQGAIFVARHEQASTQD